MGSGLPAQHASRRLDEHGTRTLVAGGGCDPSERCRARRLPGTAGRAGPVRPTSIFSKAASNDPANQEAISKSRDRRPTELDYSECIWTLCDLE